LPSLWARGADNTKVLPFKETKDILSLSDKLYHRVVDFVDQFVSSAMRFSLVILVAANTVYHHNPTSDNIKHTSQ
jgi:hypothetical protein